MTVDSTQIAKALRLLETAEASLKTAREILGGKATQNKTAPRVTADQTSAYDDGEMQIVEGVFDGQGMIGPNEKTYPVPANYASKSKMIEGDRLKLTIMPNGSFLYKQIAPIDREHVKGTLITEDGQFKVAIEGGQTYRVILASVTYYKGSAGDEVTLIIPKDRIATWGAIEAIIPQVGGHDLDETDSF
jgi:hypothetical protein